MIDDEDEIRQSLEYLLCSVGLKVKTFSCAQDFLESCDPSEIGCLLIDVRMPRMSGLMLQDELIARKIDAPIIFLSGHADLPVVVTAMKKGAFDFFLKPFSEQMLLDAIDQALDLAHKTRTRKARDEELQTHLALLTSKERQILERLRINHPAKAIAHEMGLSRKTVDTHVATIRRKMRAESTTELFLMLQDAPA
ncbi:MAG: response regulator [Phycisphaerales bacterium]